jgi:hypothetical protein
MNRAASMLRLRETGRSMEMTFRVNRRGRLSDAEIAMGAVECVSLPALASAAKVLAEKLVGRSSWNGRAACSECHVEASTTAEIEHNPQCAVGKVLNLLGQRSF